MTAIELNACKMELLSEIVNGFNTEDALLRLKDACRFIKDKEQTDKLPAMSAVLLDDLMMTALAQDKAGLSISNEELKKRMNRW